MGSVTDTLEANIAKAIGQNTSLAFGATLYWGLATAMTDSSYTEIPNAFSYARVAMTANATNMPITGSNPTILANGIAVTWPTASGLWGTPAFVFIANTATWGSAITTIGPWQAINSPTAVGSGQTPSLAIYTGAGTGAAWSVD